MSERARLPSELGSLLVARTDRDRMQRMWRGLRQRRERRARRVRALLASALAVSVIGIAAAVVAALTIDGAPPPETVAAPAAPVELRAADGASVVTFEEGTTRLSDGSSIEVGRGARLDVVDNGADLFETVLRSGRVHFSVRPGGPRRWTIDCGLATVRVVGTVFTLARTNGSLHVSVARGAVSVRGERVPGLARTLRAGESIVIEREPPAEEPAPVAAPADEGCCGEERAERRTVERWRSLAARGAYDEAWALLGARGIAERSSHASADELLALADVARWSGHPEEAVEPLERLLAAYPSEPNAALGAFTLGRLEADSLRHPDAAARAFERALSMPLPASLVPHAIVRLARARRAAGDREGATAAAERYLRENPAGTYAESMRRLLREEER